MSGVCLTHACRTPCRRATTVPQTCPFNNDPSLLPAGYYSRANASSSARAIDVSERSSKGPDLMYALTDEQVIMVSDLTDFDLPVRHGDDA